MASKFNRIPLSAYPNDPMLRVECKPGFGQIYKITPIFSDSKSNGYVGLNTTSLAHRLSSHLAVNSKCHGLRNAIKAHGLDNFMIEVAEGEVPLYELQDAEIKWVAHYDTHKNGYNCTPGGDANPMDDPEVRARHKAAMSNPEFIKRCVEKRAITFATPEFKAKKTASHTAAWTRPGTKEKLVATLKAGWADPKVRDREATGAQTKARWADPDSRKKVVNAMIKASKRPDVKAAKSKESANRWKDPVWRAKQIEKRQKPNTAATFAKHSAASKAAWTPERKASHSAKLKANALRKKALAAGKGPE